jgi:DNA-binding NtrC family response regulator
MSKKNILVVDDDEGLLKIYRELLETEGYNVVTASTSREALSKEEKTKFNLAILDIVLPDVQGDELAREIKKLDEKIEIIFITGYPEFQSCIDSLDIGVADILLKPLTREEILRATESALVADNKGAAGTHRALSRMKAILTGGFTSLFNNVQLDHLTSLK